tara:strand:+ start:138 stop:518 length:381 start_codon:yes stop_codon:yes gene_type:complete
MSHFAKVTNGVVTKVIVAEQEFIDTYQDGEPGVWVQTSYNTHGGVHYVPNQPDTPSEDQSKALRKNFAGTNWIYDRVRDAFYEPQPYPSWTLNEDTCWWEPPTAYPSDGKYYDWDESSKSWVEPTN